MAGLHGERASGKRNVFYCKAGSALAKGDIVQSIEATGARTVDNAASNAPVFGVTLEAIASGANGLVDRLSPGDRVWVKVSSGTVSDTLMLKFGDLVDEASVTTTASNNDVRFLEWDGVTTNYAIVGFTTTEAGTATVAI